MLKKIVVSALAALLVLTGCNNKSTTPDKPKFKVTSIVSDSWLRERVPETALAYVRVPNAWNFFSAKNDSFYYAQGNQEHVQQIAQLQKAVIERIDGELPPPFKPLANLLLKHAKSALEVLVVPSMDQPQPQAIASLTVDFNTAEAFKTFLEGLSADNPMVQLAKPLDDKGKALLQLGPMAVDLEYKNQRLTMLIGTGLQEGALDEVLASIDNVPSERFKELELAADDTGKGTFVWINTTLLLPMASKLIPPQIAGQIQAFGLDKVKSLAIGMGTAKQKGRLRIAFEIPASEGFRQFAPVIEHKVNIKTVGEPSFVMHLGMPDSKELTQIVAQASMLNSNVQQKFDEFNTKSKKEFGIDVLEWLNAYGDIVVFKDDIGVFGAQKIRDKIAYRKLALALFDNIKELGTKSAAESEFFSNDDMFKSISNNIALNQRNIDGQTIYHLRVPGFYAEALNTVKIDGVPQAVIDTVLGGDNHLYWTVEDGYLIFAAVPQMLIERNKAKKLTTIAAWQKQNGLDQTGSLLSLTGSFKDGPTQLYYGYLSLLSGLADGVDAKFDIFSFPIASELGLPERSIYSFQIDSTAKHIVTELTYEKTVADVLFNVNSSMVTVAMVGIIAAVALPAYTDYTVRATVTEAVLGSSNIKDQLIKFYLDNKRYPNAKEVADFDLTSSSEWIASISIEPQTGFITVDTQGKSGMQGKQIWFSPEAGVNELQFSCESNIDTKYLPINCR